MRCIGRLCRNKTCQPILGLDTGGRLLGYHQGDLAQPMHQRIRILEASQYFLAEIGWNLLLDAAFFPDDEVLQLDVFDMRAVGIESLGWTRQFSFFLQAAVVVLDGLGLDHFAETCGIGNDRLADCSQAIRGRHVFTTGDQQLTVGIDVEVIGRSAAGAWFLQTAGSQRCGEMGLVRALVVREAHVAVDAKQCFLWIAAGDDGIELADICDQHSHQFQKLGPQNVITWLVHDEPGAVIVLRQLCQILSQITDVHTLALLFLFVVFALADTRVTSAARYSRFLCYSRSSRFGGGRLPTTISSVVSCALRSTVILAFAPGVNCAIRFNISVVSLTVLPSTLIRISPGLMPALSAGPPLSTPAMMAPVFFTRPKLSASSGVMSCGSTPIQPRTTWPWLMMASMTFLAVDIGIAKPMPRLPPVRE